MVIVIAAMAAMAVPQYQKAIWRARYAEMYSMVGSIARAKEAYRLQYGDYGESRTYAVDDVTVGNGISGNVMIMQDLGISIPSRARFRYEIRPYIPNGGDVVCVDGMDGCSRYFAVFDYVNHSWTKTVAGKMTTPCPSWENFIPPP